MPERRKHPRRAVALRGTIMSGGFPSVINCTVLDLSAGGARLEVEYALSIPGIPDTFDLLIYPGQGEGIHQRRCKVVWKAENRLGVSFR
jgi:hypothetical protein